MTPKVIDAVTRTRNTAAMESNVTDSNRAAPRPIATPGVSDGPHGAGDLPRSFTGDLQARGRSSKLPGASQASQAGVTRRGGSLNLSERRELNNGFGEALARAFELVVTPAIFGVAGYFLDRKLGVVPVFTLLFSLFVVSYEFWKFWKLYEADMARHEQSLPARRAPSGDHS
jgi:hypothetical protein